MTSEDPLNILLIGSGGREHALAWKLSQSRRVHQIYVCGGNGGTAVGMPKVSNLAGFSETDFTAQIEFCRHNNVGLVVVGPEKPLVEGAADFYRKAGIPCFGPSAKAAQLEGSKAFSKDFMCQYGIPTAEYRVFTHHADAKAYLESIEHRVVIKASGLAAGKGVLIPESKQQALRELEMMMVDRVFGSAGDAVVIEEFLEGEECSVLAFSDGYTVVPMPAAQDHKRVGDGDKGPNTGGMGAYAPAPICTPQLMERIQSSCLQPTVDGMRRQGSPFVGVLYCGVMVLPDGQPRVLEFNCRFGDPETQVLLPLLQSDLAEIMLACCGGYLDSVPVNFLQNQAAATVVCAAAGYPGDYTKGLTITLSPSLLRPDTILFHAGTSVVDEPNGSTRQLVSSGGRVLAITGVGETLLHAQSVAYASLQAGAVRFEGMHYRSDIGYRALNRQSSTAAADKAGATYADAGVSIDRGNSLVEQIKAVVRRTSRPGSDAQIGGFGGLFDLRAAGYTEDPLLVSATDGVGTKLKIAHLVGRHDTIGVDLVAMNVNDLIVQGAEPLLFLDYFACGKLDVSVAKQVVQGIATGCLQANCALVGGETAEMPGMYQGGDYDLAGFTVGAVERHQLLPRVQDVRVGDRVLGLPSSGVHSNGYSLVRHLVQQNGFSYQQQAPFDSARSLGQALLEPTRIYVRSLLPVVRSGLVKALAHITGGGFVDNIPRVLPDNVGVRLDASRWPLLPVFKWLKQVGKIADDELARTFNCGIGMILIVGEADVSKVKQMLHSNGEPDVYEIGEIVERAAAAASGEHSVVVENTVGQW